MPIDGYYNPDYLTPAPYLQAHVHLPRLSLGASVDFLIDTGSDDTCLHPTDNAMLRIDHSVLDAGTRERSSGIGGSLWYYQEDAVLTFRSRNREVYYWECRISICQEIGTHDAESFLQGMPSLLGRDFLNLCVMQANCSEGQFALDPVNVSQRLILPPQ